MYAHNVFTMKVWYLIFVLHFSAFVAILVAWILIATIYEYYFGEYQVIGKFCVFFILNVETDKYYSKGGEFSWTHFLLRTHLAVWWNFLSLQYLVR